MRLVDREPSCEQQGQREPSGLVRWDRAGTERRIGQGEYVATSGDPPV
jgi:hypothetical protein